MVAFSFQLICREKICTDTEHTFIKQSVVEAPTRLLSHSKHVETEEELILDEEASYDDEGLAHGKT